MPTPSHPAAPRLTAALALGLVLAAGAVPAAAQFAAPRPAPRPATQTASLNLIGLPFGFVSGEYERTIGTSGLAFGVGGTASFDDNNVNDVFNDNTFGENARYRSLQAKLKYYPAMRGLRGFAIGVTAGVASASGHITRLVGFDSVALGGGRFDFVNVLDRRRYTDTRPTVGTVLDYNFLLGPKQRFLVGLGIGARRTIGDPERVEIRRPGGTIITGYNPSLDRTLFDGRLQIGVGF